MRVARGFRLYPHLLFLLLASASYATVGVPAAFESVKGFERPVVFLMKSHTGKLNLTLPLEKRPENAGISSAKLEICAFDAQGRLVHRFVEQRGLVPWQLSVGESPALLGPYWIHPARPIHPERNASSGVRLFEDVTGTALPHDSSWATAAAIGDLDGDGDLDLVVAQSRDTIATSPQVLINDGTGAFRDEARTRLPKLDLFSTAVSLVDVDLNGDLDLFFANRGTLVGAFQHNLLINDGTGHFVDESEKRLPDQPLCAGSVQFGDLTGDGAPDMVGVPLFLELDSLSLLIFPNDGNGNFPDSLVRCVRLEPRYTTDIALADLDGDGDLDVVLGCMPITLVTIGDDTTVTELTGRNAVLVNDGFGNLRDESTLRLPLAPEDATGRVLPGDVDGDGDVDLFFSNRGFKPEEATNRLWINDGTGTFSEETATRLPTPPSLWNNGGVLADFTGDGTPEVFLPSVAPDSGGLARDVLYVNDGSGHFEDRSETDLPDILDFSVDAAAGDVDGDGDLDLFVANTTPRLRDTTMAINRLYGNTGVLSAISGVAGREMPEHFTLYPACPNPFNASTWIRFEILAPATVELVVHNVRGERIRVLLHRRLAAGSHNLRWDGDDDTGRPLPSGIYLVQLQAGGQVAVRKVVLVR